MEIESLGPVPPQDTTAEQSVLGAMMLSKDAAGDCIEIIKSRDFYTPRHELIFEAITDLYSKNKPTDAVAVCDQLTKRKDLNRIGGATYLHTLISCVPTAANGSYYAGIVADKAILRRLVDAGTRIAHLGQSQEGETLDLVQAAHAEMHHVTAEKPGQGLTAVTSIIQPVIDQIEAAGSTDAPTPGLSTGLTELDDLTGGLHPGQVIVIAARPAVGKSTLGLDFARHAAITTRVPALFFSLEMSREEIMLRLLSAEGTLPLHLLRNGKLDDRHWTAMATTMGRINDAPLYIDDSPNLTIHEIRSKARRFAQHHAIGLVVIDYLQLMKTGKRAENRQQEVSEISRDTKLLAKELGVPVIAISQLNRGSEHRDTKKPQLSDLRESGSIEQDADVVILLHRADLYDPESLHAGEADLIVAKHRNGPTRTITTRFQGHYSRFVDLDSNHLRSVA